jgi:double-stranded uracil-DNA glycosylase
MGKARLAARVRSFAPIAGRGARILILGSMPGVASLLAKQYYAHSQNNFWPIMGELLGFDPSAPYLRREQALRTAHIAVWDVLRSCVREGSLDARIEAEIANDFDAFFRTHRGITHVFFNGAKAEASFKRAVLPEMKVGLRFSRLPSTSPAHASLPYRRKLAAWRAILERE